MTKTLRGVIKTDDRSLIERIAIVLKEFGAFPRAVHWNVARPDGSSLEPPMIGFNLAEAQMGEVVRGFSSLGITVYVLPVDPVAEHCYLDEQEIAGEKYVVVKWMPPMEDAIAVVDTDDTQFVVVLDLRNFPVERENEVLIAEFCGTLQHAANEMNRLNARVKEVMRGKPTLVEFPAGVN